MTHSKLARLGLTRVINASGTMTALGAAQVGDDARQAACEAMGDFVMIDELQARASGVITRLTGAEGGCFTACSAAGMTLGVAACMTGSNLARIEQLPDTGGMRNEVVVPAGHLINFGAPIEQMVRLAGGRVIAAGSAADVQSYHVTAKLGSATAAGLYVVSHHVVPDGQIGLEDFVALCHGSDVPVIVDMASEYDLKGAIALGADLVVYSAHKFLGGPTGGIVAGRLDLVRSLYLQNRGIGRAMKIGKEGILGGMAALEAWERRDHAAVRREERQRLEHWLGTLSGKQGLAVEITPDWTGNPIDRLRVIVDPRTAGLFAWELADRLAAGDPAIMVRDDLVEHGHFFLDPCNLRSGEEKIVADRILSELDRAATAAEGRQMTFAEWRQRATEAALAWPRR